MSFLLVVVVILLSLPIIRTMIIIPIAIHTTEAWGLIIQNLIIIAIQPIAQSITITREPIVITIDLQIDIAALYAKSIMVAIDGKSKGAVSDVDEVVIAWDRQIALPVLDELLGTVVKDVHYLQCLYDTYKSKLFRRTSLESSLSFLSILSYCFVRMDV